MSDSGLREVTGSTARKVACLLEKRGFVVQRIEQNTRRFSRHNDEEAWQATCTMQGIPVTLYSWEILSRVAQAKHLTLCKDGDGRYEVFAGW